jgi:hypothetical protein
MPLPKKSFGEERTMKTMKAKFMDTDELKGKTGSFLFRFRSIDTPTGVSEETVNQLMSVTGLNKTEITHLALKQMADKFIPAYEADNGPITEEQDRWIREKSVATNVSDGLFTERLF